MSKITKCDLCDVYEACHKHGHDCFIEHEDKPIGTLIESRADGSFIYMSHRGILNLDDWRDLDEAKARDAGFLGSCPN
ncbi:MAG: hypothetical protein GY861_05825 [bacterium]|nr:hypothetical protein [bacterium]